jgi:putative transposase
MEGVSGPDRRVPPRLYRRDLDQDEYGSAPGLGAAGAAAQGQGPPHGRWKTMTFLAALRHDRLDAPWLIDGPINGERFRLYVETVLAPSLKPGDIVVLDNLGSHRSKAVRRTIRSVGARLFFLPKYSPDLNPIEQLFAKLKHQLRKAAARTADTVCNAIGEIIEALTPQECRNYFAEAGYDRS